MCGIAGLVCPARNRSGPELECLGARMADALAHRGPDDAGVWSDAQAGVALAHRRLAVLDLSPAGHQPMISAHGRYVLSYNGEIFNFAALRRELAGAGCAFRGASDTEVLLAAIETWGLETTLARADGMFAFALWDRTDRSLTLARDRMGIKPLCYGWCGSAFAFASEMRALRTCPEFGGTLSRSALALFTQLGYVPAPHTIYEGIRKLPPGHWLRLGPETMAARRYAESRAYWSLPGPGETSAAGAESPEADLGAILADAVRQHLVSDVPLGAFLSGGVDSSLLVALMRAEGRAVKTFTMAFPGTPYDEAPHARAVAAHLGTEHTEMAVTDAEALAVVPELGGLYDEPFGDASQIPAVLLSRLTRGHVTVALSGDGGDELFCGYPRYLQRAPGCLRRLFAHGLRGVPLSAWEGATRALRLVAPGFFAQRTAGDMVPRLASLLETETLAGYYVALMYHWHRVPVRNAMPAAAVYLDPPSAAEPARALMHMDSTTYLPDDILVKVDRASMSVGLEVRVPFLDHRVVEYAARLPLAALRRGGQGKLPLRRLLARHLPAPLVERPKKGFGVPLAAWLRGPLRPWVEDLLRVDALNQDGLFDAAAVRRAWQEHAAGTHDWKYPLWDVLMFQAWRANAVARGV